MKWYVRNKFYQLLSTSFYGMAYFHSSVREVNATCGTVGGPSVTSVMFAVYGNAQHFTSAKCIHDAIGSAGYNMQPSYWFLKPNFKDAAEFECSPILKSPYNGKIIFQGSQHIGINPKRLNVYPLEHTLVEANCYVRSVFDLEKYRWFLSYR